MDPIPSLPMEIPQSSLFHVTKHILPCPTSARLGPERAAADERDCNGRLAVACRPRPISVGQYRSDEVCSGSAATRHDINAAYLCS